MRNVTLPTPVFVAGCVLLLLAGALIGAVAGPERANHTTATVVSYQLSTNRLCLGGSGVKGASGVGSSGDLCGTWRRTSGSLIPTKGEKFRYVSVVNRGYDGAPSSTVIYGDVVR